MELAVHQDPPDPFKQSWSQPGLYSFYSWIVCFQVKDLMLILVELLVIPLFQSFPRQSALSPSSRSLMKVLSLGV